MEIVKDNCYKGTRILVGNKKSMYLEYCKKYLREVAIEIHLPIIFSEDIFKDKVGKENNNLMYTFKDRGNRELCLAPEYTAVIQKLSETKYKDKKDVALFYIAECFRGEKPQKGRYRQFTQLGLEILNPSRDFSKDLPDVAHLLLQGWNKKVDYTLNTKVTRGLDYYIEGSGFEISCSELGQASQIVGGGSYKNGIGFAIGIDRLMLLKNE